MHRCLQTALVVASLAFPSAALAEETPFVGGLGKAYVGGMALSVGGLEGSLRPHLGTDAAIGDLAAQVGGGGFAMIGGVVLAGGGYGVFVPTSDGAQGGVALGGGGGGVALGYAVVNTREWIVYPSFGVGGFGYTMTITNTGGSPITLGSDDPIATGEQADFDAGFLTVDMGISANRLLFFGDGGFAVGLDAGFLTSVMSSNWEHGNAVADLLERARLRGVYMRLTVGGGGFYFSE
ncbi:MAG: hypothetical protein R3B72_34910 [Polyangiaceae bacterium]